MTRPAVPRALLPVLLAALAALTACSREADDWRAAQAADTVASYERFVRDHPASSHATEAQRRAAQLAEDEDWRRAQEEDSLQAYQLFVSQHPDSRWAAEARVRIETILLGGPRGDAPAVDPPAATGGRPPAPGPSAAPPPAPAAPTPPTPPAAPAASDPAPAAGSPYGIQLGAYSSEASARTQWQALAARHSAQLGGRSPRIVSASTANGRVYRLQTATRDEAEARRLCAALTSASQPCVVVLP